MRLNTVAFISVALLAASPAFSQGFSGAEVAWATSLREREPMPAGGVLTASRGEPLYFWIRIQGNAEALGELESKGMLPIRHRWVRYGGLSSSVELDATPTDEIVLAIGKEALLPRLRQELDARRHFDWRTWSTKNNLRAGRWAVDVLYGDARRSPVQCRIAEETGTKPCHFEIDVR